MNRQQRIDQAQNTLAILESGRYIAPSGQIVDIGEKVRFAVERTVTIAPDEWPRIVSQAKEMAGGRHPRIYVTAETTLSAAARLARDSDGDVLALNFASARNPGGGFQSGAQAQEESLARASALFASLRLAENYYSANRQNRSLIYTDHAIYSPRVPVFYSDDGNLLEVPFSVSFFTSPAPNRGAIDWKSRELEKIAPAFARRIEQLFAFAALHGHRSLVLGAWGCGVFRNNPREVAESFSHGLLHGGWAKHFDEVCFAVFDTSLDQATLHAFQSVFSGAKEGV